MRFDAIVGDFWRPMDDTLGVRVRARAAIAPRGTPHAAPPCQRLCSPRTTRNEAIPLARRQSPQTFEKRRREQAKKLKKATKQEARVWRNAEKRDAKLRVEDPEAWRRLQEQRRRDEEQWYYG